jgi:hypothetical protein
VTLVTCSRKFHFRDQGVLVRVRLESSPRCKVRHLSDKQRSRYALDVLNRSASAYMLSLRGNCESPLVFMRPGQQEWLADRQIILPAWRWRDSSPYRYTLFCSCDSAAHEGAQQRSIITDITLDAVQDWDSWKPVGLRITADEELLIHGRLS